MKNVRAASFALALLAAASPAQAVEYGFPVALRQVALYMVHPEFYGTPRDYGFSALRVRPEFYARGERVRFDVGLDAGASFTTLADSGLSGALSPLGSPRALRAYDTEQHAEYLGEDNIEATADIERLDVQIATSVLDLDIGRQPISLGSSHFMSVLDVLAPFGPGSLDSTFKPGIDAVRARRSLSDRAELELILAAANPIDEFAALLRSRFSVKWADFEIIGGRFRERMMGGVGLETEAGPVGIWAEGAVFQEKDPLVAYTKYDRVALSGTAGVEGRPHDKLMLSGGALWQDYGARKPEQYFDVMVYSDPHNEGWVYLVGAAYGFGTIAWEAHPLVNLSGSLMVNMLDGSTLSQPTVAVNVADNADLTAFGWISTGRASTWSTTSATIRSEFGLYPSGGGLYARWFF